MPISQCKAHALRMPEDLGRDMMPCCCKASDAAAQTQGVQHMFYESIPFAVLFSSSFLLNTVRHRLGFKLKDTQFKASACRAVPCRLRPWPHIEVETFPFPFRVNLITARPDDVSYQITVMMS